MQGLDLAVIGNCAVAALVSPQARHEWFCFPRLDAEPVFDLDGSACWHPSSFEPYRHSLSGDSEEFGECPLAAGQLRGVGDASAVGVVGGFGL